MAQYRLVGGDKSIEIGKTEFESAKADRDKLLKLLEIESWFAEVRLSVFSWQEKMTRFAARRDSEELAQHLQVQIDCELTSRISSVMIGTHGLRPRIDKAHSDCVLEPACTIAAAIRDSLAHESTRLLNITSGYENLWLTAPQLKSMPNGGRKTVVLRMKGEKLEEQQRRHKPKKLPELRHAIAELFPDGNIDVVSVVNSHLACINKSMKAYRDKYEDPSVLRSSLLERHGLVGKSLVGVTCGEDKIWLGSPVDEMIETILRLRREHSEVSTIELIQFGQGEFRAGSLENARDRALELSAKLGLADKKTKEVAVALDLADGYPGEALCNDAPPLFKDAIERVYKHAHELSRALLWPGYVVRLLPRRLSHYKPKTDLPDS